MPGLSIERRRVIKTRWPLVKYSPLRHHSDDSVIAGLAFLIGRDQILKTTLDTAARTASSDVSSSRAYRTMPFLYSVFSSLGKQKQPREVRGSYALLSENSDSEYSLLGHCCCHGERSSRM